VPLTLTPTEPVYQPFEPDGVVGSKVIAVVGISQLIVTIGAADVGARNADAVAVELTKLDPAPPAQPPLPPPQ
jgi:hypothetical protein